MVLLVVPSRRFGPQNAAIGSASRCCGSGRRRGESEHWARAEAAPAAPPPAPPKAEDNAAASSDPLGALAKAKSGSAEAPQISYYVQVGAFRTPEDAQAQRAKLALTGVDAKVTEREQGGRPLFRVRVGPFEKIEEAERAKEKLDKAGNETALVKVQR